MILAPELKKTILNSDTKKDKLSPIVNERISSRKNSSI